MAKSCGKCGKNKENIRFGWCEDCIKEHKRKNDYFEKESKICPNCGRELLLNEENFYKRSICDSGTYQSWCKECMKKYGKKYRKKLKNE